MNETLYIKFAQDIRVDSPDVFLGRLGSMWCKDKSVMSKCMALKLFTADKAGRYIYSMLEVVQLIKQSYPDLDVENMGEEDFIVEYMPPKKRFPVWEWSKLAVIWIITFCGSAFAIMTFNNDVSVKDVFSHLYELITGESKSGYGIIEIGYTVGVALGILVFYNHFSLKKDISDPTPLEVEMRKYESELYTSMIDTKDRDGKDEQST